MLKTLAVSAVMVAMVAMPQTQYLRPSDTDVKNLIAQVGQARDRYADALDSNLKHSILRGASGEVDVQRYLDDLKRNVDQVKDRYNDQYAASTEVLTLLRQGTDINAFMLKQPGAFKGKSEWDTFAAALGSLATVYGTSFPLPQGASTRRMNDLELAASAANVGQMADQFRKAATKAMKTAKADPKLVTSIDAGSKAVTTSATTLKKRLTDHKPATNEARMLLEEVNKLKTLLAQQPPAGESTTAWEGVLSGVKTIAEAFNLPGI
jgi:hypothetical protein